MHNQTSIGTALDLDGSSEAVESHYDDWAENYDRDVTGENYSAPQTMAALAATAAVAYLHRPASKLKVLDAGCGTGLVALAMKSHGFAPCHGFDLSSEMVERAGRTGAYCFLESHVDLSVDPVACSGRDFDMIVCCGVFTQGHVAPGALKGLSDLLAPGGLMIISTRKSYLASSGYEAVVAALEAAGHFHRVAHLGGADYIAEEPADYWVYRTGRAAAA